MIPKDKPKQEMPKASYRRSNTKKKSKSIYDSQSSVDKENKFQHVMNIVDEHYTSNNIEPN